MPRARNIKPSFFDNEELAELDPYERLLFIGLWTLADHKGRLEYRPKRIKKQILGYDEVNIDELLTNLDKSRFIMIYKVNEISYIEIPNFTKHQNPHPNEIAKGSNIPDPTQVFDSNGVTINHDLSRQVIEYSQSDPADSCSLIPDSCSLNPEKKGTKAPITKNKKFKKPTPEEIQTYCDKRGNGLSGKVIFDHYETGAWMRGKTKIQDWKACVRTWGKNNQSSVDKNNPSYDPLAGAI